MLGQEAVVQVVTGPARQRPAVDRIRPQDVRRTAGHHDRDGQPNGQAGGQLKQTYTPNAKTIDGVQFNLMQTTMAPAGPGQPRTRSRCRRSR
jgi:hypothetical protein